ncbi:MAG TPA: hypothetical protein PKU73_01430 [Defluviitoga sp.]|nr:hypothetical protein [Defluviitoga sp.]
MVAVVMISISTTVIANSIEEFVEFSPKGYVDINRVVMRNGNVLETPVPEEGVHLQISFKKNRGIYEVHVIYFESVFTLMNFWYNFVGHYSDNFVGVFSAVPFIYGEFNTEYSKLQVSAWFTGYNNTFFAVYGPKKSVVNDLKLKLNKK